ncbi:host cell division inhibitor Icd-like protein [Escherichia coli]|nr:host cell division inhibitor Icd-like protein [Escherichia coli]EHZ8281189.1 host cell division inhibitor Icd-like protein [Escherichia coli]EID8839538.1 host cell division inhibitor Icd-like protein [Escherichia coli]EIN1297940.1 host cell division inhibitor Icd-like protein [Escherichia coli]EIY9320332.1 host cell division inhibitor Icd-like protein [Escherichia coli]
MNTGYTPVQGRGFVRPEKQNLQNFAVISGLIGGSETNIVNARALQMFDDEKGVNLTYPPDGNQNMSIISESVFYKLIKTKSAPLPERPCEQLTCCEKNGSVQGNYINRVAKRHNCRITGKTKATRYGGPSTQAARYPQRMSIANNATFAAGGQCDQSDLVRSKVCNESFFLRSLRNFSRANEQGANLSDSCSIFLRRLFRVGDNVLVNSLSVIVLSCIAMRRSYSHHGADSDYSDSLAFRRCSYFNLRPQASKTHAEKLALGLVNFSCSTLASIPSISSCGNRIFFFADLLFVLPLDIDAPHLNGLYGRTQYSKKNEMLSIDMCAHMILICAHSLSFVTQIKQRPAVLATHAGRLTTNDSKSIEVAMRNHTTHPQGRDSHNLNKFIWRFIALSTAQPRVIHIVATSEQEARQQSPAGCVMVFAARIRQGVSHA